MGQKIILPELVLESKINKHFQYSGIDSIEFCENQQHFLSYPHNIEYSYNSRGFRDSEWPESDLHDAIWCIGDSFTVGLGSPAQHTWPSRVAIASNQRTINVSMDGASNNWIARATELIANEFNPKNIIVMWSYTHRREHPDASRDSEHRRLHYVKSTVGNDWQNFLDCHNKISLIDSNIIEFTIPQFHHLIIPNLNKFWNLLRGQDWPSAYPTTVNELNELPENILLELHKVHNQLDNYRAHLTTIDTLKQHNIIPTETLGLARDGYHFDCITADWVAAQAVLCLT